MTHRPLIVFAHGNGFPGGTYQPLFKPWEAAGYEVMALDRFGHDPRFPVTGTWHGLRDQLIQFIDARCQPERTPVWLVGHSLGGLVSLLATSKRPDLVRGLVMLDSPVITGWRAHSVHMLKRSGLLKRVSPGKVAQRRRYHWPDRAAVQAHFAAKSVFARWHPDALAAYVAAGVQEAPQGGVELAFHRDVEARIYNTLPHHLGTVLRRHPVRCPVGFIAGTQSEEMRQGGSTAARALAGERFVRIEGTHLYPMEKPHETAQLVLGLLAGMA